MPFSRLLRISSCFCAGRSVRRNCQRRREEFEALIVLEISWTAASAWMLIGRASYAASRRMHHCSDSSFGSACANGRPSLATVIHGSVDVNGTPLQAEMMWTLNFFAGVLASNNASGKQALLESMRSPAISNPGGILDETYSQTIN